MHPCAKAAVDNMNNTGTSSNKQQKESPRQQEQEGFGDGSLHMSCYTKKTLEKLMDVESPLLFTPNAYYQEGLLPNRSSPILPPRLHQQSWFLDDSSSFYDHPRRDSLTECVLLQIIEDEENAEDKISLPTLDKEPEKNGVRELAVRLLCASADTSTRKNQQESLFPLDWIELEPTPIGPDAKVFPSRGSMQQCCKESLSAVLE